jgi:hypothetical protein
VISAILSLTPSCATLRERAIEPAEAPRLLRGVPLTTPCFRPSLGGFGAFCLKGNLMKSLLITLLMAVAQVASAQEYAPPQRIWYKVAPEWTDGYMLWFHDFTWIGDQNGDGCDELLVSEEPAEREYPRNVNIVELYYGGQNMSDQPDVVFHSRRQYESVGIGVSFLGNLTGNGPYNFAINNGAYDAQHPLDMLNWYIDIYQGGDQFDTIPDYTLSRRPGLHLINNDRPCDINGDGYNDLLALAYGFGEEDSLQFHSMLYVYYGGPDFDTIPDDSLYNNDLDAFGAFSISANGDINGDGCDDLFIWSYYHLNDPNNYRMLNLYLGGHPMENNPKYSYVNNWIDNSIGISNHNIMGNIANTQEGDWVFGLIYGDPRWEEAHWLYFGSDSLDSIPDLSLVPGPMPSGGGRSQGGDANGDGRGDLILKGTSMGGVGDIRIYLGSEWFDTTWAVRLDGWTEVGMTDMRRTQGA